jgi:FkbM family methyltransferase
MNDRTLTAAFRQRLRYKQAKTWEKPLINPGRFLRNQMIKYGVFRGKAGCREQVAAFHVPRFEIVCGESVSEQIRAYGIYEENLTEAFIRLIQPGQVVFDIGMHLGYYTTLFACLAGPEGAVHAFEPTPSTREIARANVQHFPQVTVHPFAVWSSEQKLPFRDYGLQWMAFNSFTKARMDSGPPPPTLFEAQTITLDRFWKDLGQTIALVKIDAESAEREILLGGRELLQADQPIVSLEVGDTEGKQESGELIEFMESAGYHAWELARGKFIRHQQKESYSYDNLIFAPGSKDLSDL